MQAIEVPGIELQGIEIHVEIRPIRPQDAEQCGEIAHYAYSVAAAAYNLPSERPSPDFSIALMRARLCDPNAYGVLGEDESGQVTGTVFLNTFPPDPVASIGPLSVHPSAEDGVERQLMLAALGEARRRGFKRIRLVQSPEHLRSMARYTKLGFAIREPLVLMQGAPAVSPAGGRTVRAAHYDDGEFCNSVCAAVHGFSRSFEFKMGIRQGTAIVVEKSGRVTGYATGLGFRSHAVAETAGDLKALMAAAPRTIGPGFFVPARNTEVLRWLVDAGCRPVSPATLMTIGPYQEPSGAFLPSIAF
jgi:L-amino acid N-acyltransferase YncA